MTLRLVVVDPAKGGALVAEGSFTEPEVVFGRRAGVAQMVIPDPTKQVSSRHGCFRLRGDTWHVRDLGSLNGTLLHGRTVPTSEDGVPVSHGDVLSIGRLEMQVFQDAARAPVDDFELTQVSTDIGGRAAQLGYELEAVWAEHEQDPRARAGALRLALRKGIADLMPDQGRAVLSKMAERWGGSVDSGGDEAQEALFRAGFECLSDLSRTLVGDAKFQQPDHVARFVVLLRQCIELTSEWVARNLAAREAFGEEFGAEVTMVFKRTANPLKKEEDAGAILRYLLDWQDDRPPSHVASYLQGVFEDLSEHQMGVLAGVHEAINAVVERLAPKGIEELADRQGWSLSSRGAKAWEAYCKLYSDLLEERTRLFQEVVSPAIRRGYLGSHQPPQNKPEDAGGA